MKIRTFLLVVTIVTVCTLTALGQDGTPGSTGTAPETATTQVQDKREGVIRIGIVGVKVAIPGATASDLSELIRTRWGGMLNGPTLETVAIDAQTPTQARIEAQQKQCDYILYSTLSQKSKGSLFGSFLKTAVPLASSVVPVGVGTGATSTVRSIRQTVQDSAKNAAKDLTLRSAAMVKAHDELTLEFIIVQVGSAGLSATGSVKAKAKTDGEDVFSTLIEQAAEKVAQATLKS